MMWTLGEARGEVMRQTRAGLAVSLGALAILGSGCVEEYDFTREAAERGTFGEEVFRVVKKDAVRSGHEPVARGALLDGEREAFVGALDTIVPEALLHPLDFLLRKLNTLIDEGIVTASLRRLAVLLDELAEDEGLRSSWAQDNAGRQAGFRHVGVQPALLARAVGFERTPELAELLGRLVEEHDGYGAGGELAPDEPGFMIELVRLLSEALRDVEVSGAPDRTSAQLAELLLQSDPALRGEGAEALAPLWVARVDHRGLPVVRRDGRGQLYAPFVDRDGDGLADADGAGHFVDFNGVSLGELAPFGAPGESGLLVRDAEGRAVSDGEAIFEYVDLNETTMAFLLLQSGEFAKRDVLFDLVKALDGVLPAPEARVDAETGVAYRGYGPDHPLMDLLYGLVNLLDFEAMDELLEAAGVLLEKHAPVLASLTLSLEEFGEVWDATPGASLRDDNTLVDDLVPVVAEIASTPGLVTSLLEASSDPVLLATGPANAELLRWRGAVSVEPGGAYDRCFFECARQTDAGTLERASCVQACPRGELFSLPVDRAGLPTRENRSHFHRLLGLIHDTDGVIFEMQVTELEIPALGESFEITPEILPPLLRFPDTGVAFLEALVGELELADFVTPEALANEQVGLLVDGIETVCSRGSILGRLVEALIPVLVSVTTDDIMSTCSALESIAADGSLDAEVRQRQRIATTVVFLSLLTDVPFSARPEAWQMVRFFNLASPRLDLEVVTLSLSQLVDRDGYVLRENNGDMLYAAEASGSLDALYPLVKAFSRHGRTDLLVKLVSTVAEHWGRADITYPRADGSPAPQAGTGLVTFEPVLEAWLTQDRLIPALRELSLAGRSIRTSRGRPMEPALEEVVAHLFAPSRQVAHRDGHRTSLRADGGVVEELSWFYVVADALRALDARLEANLEAEAAWERALDNLYDLTLAVEATPEGGARFKKEGGVVLARLAVAHLGRRAAVHRDAGRIPEVVAGYYADVESVMTGRLVPALLELLRVVGASTADRALFVEFLSYSTGSVEGVAQLLPHLYTLIQEVLDEASFQASAGFYARLLDPDRAWSCADACAGPPLLTLLAELLGRGATLDAEETLVALLRGAFAQDASGEYPVSALARVVRGYHRVDPGSAAPLSAEDYRHIARSIAAWLRDDVRGVEQVFDLVEARERE